MNNSSSWSRNFLWGTQKRVTMLESHTND